MINNNKYRKVRRVLALGLSLAFILASSPIPHVPQAGKECLSASSIFGELLSPGWNTPELLRAQIAAQPDLQKLNRQLGNPKNWGVAAIEDSAQPLPTEKKATLESAMQDFLQKHGERLSRIRSLDTLIDVVFDPYNWHFRKYSQAELVRLIETAMQVGLYINQNGMRAHPGGPFAHARRGITPNAQGQSREPVIWCGRGLFEHPEITDHDLALLLLEDSQHILCPQRRHGEDIHSISHNLELIEKLRRIEGKYNDEETFCEMDAAPNNQDDSLEELEYMRNRLTACHSYERKGFVESIGNIMVRIPDEFKRQVLQELRERLHDEDNHVREATIFAVDKTIKSLTNEEVMHQVLLDLRKWIPEKRNTGGVAIRNIHELSKRFTDEGIKRQVLQDLREWLKDGDINVQWTAITAIRKVTKSLTDEGIKREVLQDCRKLLKKGNTDLRRAAIHDVGEMTKSLTDEGIKREVLQDLRELIKDEITGVRLAAIHALGEVTESLTDEGIKREVLQDLREQLTYDMVRDAVELALNKVIRSLTNKAIKRQVLWDLREWLKDEDIIVHYAARIGKKVIKVFCDDDDKEIKRQVLQDLREWLEDENMHVRLFAVEAMGQIVASLPDEGTKRQVLQDVRKRLKDSNELVRAFAVEATGKIIVRIPDADIKHQVLQDFRECLNEKGRLIRENTAKAIFILGKNSDEINLKRECCNILETYITNESVISNDIFPPDAIFIISCKQLLRFFLLDEIPEDKDPNYRWFLLRKLYEGFSPVGGEIHLDFRSRYLRTSEKEEMFSLVKKLGFEMDGSWYSEFCETIFEIFLLPANNTFTLQRTIEILFANQDVKSLFSSALSSLPKGKRFLRLQPTLKVDQLFWDNSGNLQEGAKYLALALEASTWNVALFYAKEVRPYIDTYGLLVEGRNIYGKETTPRERADLWEVAYLFPEDLEPGNRVPEYVRIFRQYHLIGNALLGLFRAEGKRSDLDRRLAPIAEEFIVQAKDLFTQADVLVAINTSWKSENWFVLKKLLEELNLRKMESRVSQERGIKAPEVRYGDQSYELRQAMELLLKETELKILDVVLRRYANELNETYPREDQLQEKASKLAEAMGAMEYDIISGYDERQLTEKAFSLLEDEDDENWDEEVVDDLEKELDDLEKQLDLGPQEDPPPSPDIPLGKEIPHAERNAQLREQIHSGRIFSIFPITSTNSPRNASPNLPFPLASTRPLDEAV